MANHLIGIVYDVDGDGMIVSVMNGNAVLSYNNSDVAIYNAQHARALAAMLHAAADVVQKKQEA